jgi:hypothetical protein
MVSLRGSELVLFALRGRLRHLGRDVPRLTLVPGQVIALAPGVEVEVVAVAVPPTVLALAGPGVPQQVLVGVTSVMAGPPLHLAAGVHAGAAALVFPDGLDWFVQRPGEAGVRPLAAGAGLVVDGIALCAVPVVTGAAAVPDTVPGPAADGVRLSIVSDFATVRVRRADQEGPITFVGVAARVLAELLAFGGPARWELVARAVWGEEDPGVLRHRLDVTLQKIRRRLEEGGVRRDLVSAHRDGHIELVLRPGDQAEDRG